ncbi:GDP/GTP exchange factor Sec2p [Arthroderma uncinatum]|uniref:GDP/GTP exchange factor Sec2p n=1 Tax=Arthroderma uncinatum TaxID=74035 RepID=UPI00144A67E1|nr:GDP/GTP exchange factor Sec2p [Arthroderma uncinatum]KAF3482337.1 GDP/GTP exchange factor Sec2p [Arthroderma uncinatum]
MAELLAYGLHPDRTPSKLVSRAKSSNALADMAAVVAQGPTRRSHERDRDRDRSENSLSTLRDPRVASTSDLSRTTSTSSTSHHPDLSNEVANLSDKLIQAINHQTLLDDSLAVARQELEEERRKRSTVEKEKKGIETELETLTAALFEEANKMVAAAKKEREAVERKNEQLRAQIKDTEMLLASHQEQLAELKSVIEQMNDRHDDPDTATTSTSANSPSDLFAEPSHINRLFEAMNLCPVTPGSDDIPPAPSTSFTHLLKPVCRTDILAYEDFHTLLQLSRSKPPSRVGSGSYSGLNVMNLANLASARPKSTTHTPTNSQDTNNNNNSPAGTHSSSSPSPPHGISSSPRENITSSMQLKETRFYKRILTEDIEPTLRLDMAPGISWLTRRSVMSSIVDGELIIEPIPTNNGNSHSDLPSPPSTPSSMSSTSIPCTLCGDRRLSDNPRTHRFRTSSSDNAPRHALCALCLEKMRSCCDFVGYLRLVVDGHVRTGGGEGEGREREKEAWEETVRLRERIFWARVGGGVVPAFVVGKKDENIEKAEQNGRSHRSRYTINSSSSNQAQVTDPIFLSFSLSFSLPVTSFHRESYNLQNRQKSISFARFLSIPTTPPSPRSRPTNYVHAHQNHIPRQQPWQNAFAHNAPCDPKYDSQASPIHSRARSEREQAKS